MLKEKFKREGIDAAVLVWDHNKERLFERAEYAFENSDVDGAAFHWYSGEHFDAMEVLRDMYPEKLIIESEFCSGMSRPIGNYTSEAIGNLSHGANAITEWNLMLNDEGGPYHDRKSGCLAPVLLDRSSGKVATTRVYDEMYMVSHFCGSDGTAMRTSSYDSRISVFACRRTDGKIAVCLKNNADEKLSVNLRVFGKHIFSLLLEEQEAATLIVEE